jgi:hypothetical protein
MIVICRRRDGRVWKEGCLAADAFSTCLPVIKALEGYSRDMYAADGMAHPPPSFPTILQERSIGSPQKKRNLGPRSCDYYIEVAQTAQDADGSKRFENSNFVLVEASVKSSCRIDSDLADRWPRPDTTVPPSKKLRRQLWLRLLSLRRKLARLGLVSPPWQRGSWSRQPISLPPCSAC